MAKAVTIVASGGIGVTNLASLSGFGTPMTPVDAGGVAVTLVDAGGLPVVLINNDGTLYSSEGVAAGIVLAAGGALYNPADLTSLYQSRTGGSTGASGSVVGIMLDKSRMGGQTAAAFIAGRPELVVNGNFATDTVWTKGAGWTISGGAANGASGSSTNLQQNGILVIGSWCSITFTLSAVVSGTVTPYAGGSGVGASIGANGTYTQVIRCVGDTNLYFNHALAPSDAARPLLTVSGGLAYLTTDGVDDWMNVTPTLNLGEAWWHVGGWRSDTNGRFSFATSSEGNGRSAMRYLNSVWSWADTVPLFVTLANGTPATTNVATIQQTATASISGRYNGGSATTITPYDDSASTQGLALFSIQNAAAGNLMAGRFYGGAFAPGSLSTTDRAILERFAATLSGVTLA